MSELESRDFFRDSGIAELRPPLKTIQWPGGKEIAANGMLMVGCLS